MVKLIAQTPCVGLLPLTLGSNTLAEHRYNRITSIAPFAGQTAATTTALKAAIGLPFPKPNRSAKTDTTRILWSGHGTALLCGAVAPQLRTAATTDQSSGWVTLRLRGPQIADVLARLVPLDLRAHRFKTNQTAATLLGHMHTHITRIDPQTIEIMAFRSMTRTLIHEITTVMQTLNARR